MIGITKGHRGSLSFFVDVPYFAKEWNPLKVAVSDIQHQDDCETDEDDEAEQDDKEPGEETKKKKKNDGDK